MKGNMKFRKLSKETELMMRVASGSKPGAAVLSLRALAALSKHLWTLMGDAWATTG